MRKEDINAANVTNIQRNSLTWEAEPNVGIQLERKTEWWRMVWRRC